MCDRTPAGECPRSPDKRDTQNDDERPEHHRDRIGREARHVTARRRFQCTRLLTLVQPTSETDSRASNQPEVGSPVRPARWGAR